MRPTRAVGCFVPRRVGRRMFCGKKHGMFALGWVAYASTYLLRKPLGVLKMDLQTDLSLPKWQLGWLDTSLMLPYAMAQMFLGCVGDRYKAGYIFGMSLILCGVSMIFFGRFSSIGILAFLLTINGATQSQCWPACTKVVGQWFPAGDARNTVFGALGMSAFVGGILGTSLAVFVHTYAGWRQVFIPPSIIVICLGVLVLCFFKKPKSSSHNLPSGEHLTLNVTGSRSERPIQ